MWICRNADLQKSRFAEMQICRNADLQKCRYVEMQILQKCRFAELQICKSRFADVQKMGKSKSRLYNFRNAG